MANTGKKLAGALAAWLAAAPALQAGPIGSDPTRGLPTGYNGRIALSPDGKTLRYLHSNGAFIYEFSVEEK